MNAIVAAGIGRVSRTPVMSAGHPDRGDSDADPAILVNGATAGVPPYDRSHIAKTADVAPADGQGGARGSVNPR